MVGPSNHIETAACPGAHDNPPAQATAHAKPTAYNHAEPPTHVESTAHSQAEVPAHVGLTTPVPPAAQVEPTPDGPPCTKTVEIPDLEHGQEAAPTMLPPPTDHNSPPAPATIESESSQPPTAASPPVVGPEAPPNMLMASGPSKKDSKLKKAAKMRPGSSSTPR